MTPKPCDSFDVTDSEGSIKFQVKGRQFTISRRKQIREWRNPYLDYALLEIRKERVKKCTTYYGRSTSNKRTFEVRKKFGLGGPKLTVTFRSYLDKDDRELLIKGNYLRGNSKIIYSKTGQVVAEMTSTLFGVRCPLEGEHTYHVSCAQGVDLLLITALCVCFDEMREEKVAKGAKP